MLEQEQEQRSLYVQKLECEMRTCQANMYKVENDNILLLHKMMNVRGTVRSVCRIKPEVEHECFNWSNQDDTFLKGKLKW